MTKQKLISQGINQILQKKRSGDYFLHFLINTSSSGRTISLLFLTNHSQSRLVNFFLSKSINSGALSTTLLNFLLIRCSFVSIVLFPPCNSIYIKSKYSLITCLCHYGDFIDDKHIFLFIKSFQNSKGILKEKNILIFSDNKIISSEIKSNCYYLDSFHTPLFSWVFFIGDYSVIPFPQQFPSY